MSERKVVRPDQCTHTDRDVREVIEIWLSTTSHQPMMMNVLRQAAEERHIPVTDDDHEWVSALSSICGRHLYESEDNGEIEL